MVIPQARPVIAEASCPLLRWSSVTAEETDINPRWAGLRQQTPQPPVRGGEVPRRPHALARPAAAVGVAVDDQPLVGVGQALEERRGRGFGEVALAVGDEGRAADRLDID